MKRFIVIILLTIIIVGGILWFLTYEPHQDDTVEYASRLICKKNQEAIYTALLKYREDHGILPPDLKSLLSQGYANKESLYCPASSSGPNAISYRYHPENFGKPNLPIISESPQNHSGKRLRLRKLKPVVIETMGDGKIVIRQIEQSD